MNTVELKSFVTKGGKIFPVRVTVASETGLGVHIKGSITDIQVKECLLRSATAIQSCGYRFPGLKLVIDIAGVPAGAAITGLDLPVACAIIIAGGQVHAMDSERFTLAGELGLDGSVRAICPWQDVLPEGMFILPKENLPGNIPSERMKDIFPAAGLHSALLMLSHHEGLMASLADLEEYREEYN